MESLTSNEVAKKSELTELTEPESKELIDFGNELIGSQEPLELDFVKILNENFWELL